MESSKQGSSEPSSEENIIDRQEQVKRSYECSFCKRGFTNAQALGGHMNIHRKDRANNKSKGKQLASSSSVSSKAANEENKNPRFMTSPTISSIDQATKYYPVLAAQRIKHEMYFQPQGPSPAGRPQPCNYHNHIGFSHDHDFLVPNSQSLSMNEQLWGASLSLQIGSTNVQDHRIMNRRSIPEDDYDDDHEVDLELRLGNDRKWIS